MMVPPGRADLFRPEAGMPMRQIGLCPTGRPSRPAKPWDGCHTNSIPPKPTPPKAPPRVSPIGVIPRVGRVRESGGTARPPGWERESLTVASRRKALAVPDVRDGHLPRETLHRSKPLFPGGDTMASNHGHTPPELEDGIDGSDVIPGDGERSVDGSSLTRAEMACPAIPSASQMAAMVGAICRVPCSVAC
jgi:hypothetical protein